MREEVNADVRQTLWEMGAFGDCTAEELSEGWKRPEPEEGVVKLARRDRYPSSLRRRQFLTFRTASAVAGRPAASTAA